MPKAQEETPSVRDQVRAILSKHCGECEHRETVAKDVGALGLRRRLADEREAVTHKFSVGGHEGYITVGLYKDGSPGEIFIVMAKEGSTISGLIDCFATAISIALQSRVSLLVLIKKFTNTRFEPSGHTGNVNIPAASSVVDYIFQWMSLKFLSPEERGEVVLGETPDSLQG